MARRNVLGLAAACAALWAGAGLAAEPKALTRADFQIRDPFVLPDNGTYYLYESKPWNGGKGVGVRTSTDLERWSEKRMAMTLPPEVKNTAVWAPEVHKYDGAYWLFTTLTFAPDAAHPIRPMLQEGFTGGGLQPRGVWVFRSESPLGPFRPVKAGSVTPPEWMCLDGTLWVEDGVPWMVFCHEWLQVGDGEVCEVPLTDDLRGIADEIVRCNACDKALIGLDFFDGSINRVAAWVIGTRNMQKALLLALLTPHQALAELQDSCRFTELLALQEEYKSLPWGEVWAEYCRRQDVPENEKWLSAVQQYEQQALAERK